MGELAIQNLHGNGADQITVINRTFEKAVKLAERFDGTPIEIARTATCTSRYRYFNFFNRFKRFCYYKRHDGLCEWHA